VSDLFSIKGKTALVTGGSRGIGLMIARGFIEAGARVYISSRKADACDAAAAELSKSGGECFSIPADVSTLDGVEALARALADREPALHILVNNAGAAWGAPIDEYPEAGWDKVMDTNVKGVFFLTQKLLPALRKAATPADPARVVNIGSVEGLHAPIWENFAYPASKAAVHMVTRDLAQKLAKEHITVNAIAPGFFPSKMTAFVFESDMQDELMSHIPLRRHGEPDDLAGTAIFLTSRAGSYLTGAVIPVDGGFATR
jgi:NAD(P)-dependent dehydrogenase (short-subunit alcohol dehydrogenase family)